ncbi:MAG: peptide ABC transporter substrate-binding protein [Myxococcota bacterium]
MSALSSLSQRERARVRDPEFRELTPLTPTLSQRERGRGFLLLTVALVVGAQSAHAASRARFGGTIKVAVAGKQTEKDPLFADTPLEATMNGLVAQSLCRAEPHGFREQLARFSRLSATQLRITVAGRLRNDIGSSLMHVISAGQPSPYNALLFPLRRPGDISTVSDDSLDLHLAFPWPDLERSLCHPTLAILDENRRVRGHHLGDGPFVHTTSGGDYLANARFPRGRPFADTLRVTFTDERGASRLLTLDQAHVVLGATGERSVPTGPALYATYLAFRHEKVGPAFRDAVESTIDRADLTRYFVRAPAVPMLRLLPPALMPQEPLTRAVPRPPPGALREVTLLFDQSASDQRAVAERLQVKLHDRGFKVALRALSRRELRARWSKGDFDLMLHSLLLPPAPAPALAIVLDAAGRKDLLPIHLPTLGAIPETAVRDERALALAQELLPKLELVPLYAQGLPVAVSPKLQGLTFDAQGLPMLDDAFLVESETP